ncbi:hypothetical protein ACWD0A_05730 [Streptomyces sp. NPDC002867]
MRGAGTTARPGRLRKPDLRGSHKELNTALHELHKGPGGTSLTPWWKPSPHDTTNNA